MEGSLVHMPLCLVIKSFTNVSSFTNLLIEPINIGSFTNLLIEPTNN